MILILALILEANALMASCCSSSLGLGGSRLLKHERAAIEMGLSFKQFFAKNAIHQIFEENLSFRSRIFFNIEPFVKLPLIIQRDQKHLDGGIGDATIGFFTNIIEPGYFLYLPSLFYTISLQVPSGAARSRYNKDPLSITGEGYFSLINSLTLEKNLKDIILGLNYTLSITNITGLTKYPSGFLNNLSLSFGYPLNEFHFISLSLIERFDSDSYKTSLALSSSHKIQGHVTIQCQALSDLPLPLLNKNSNNFFAFSLGLRLGVF